MTLSRKVAEELYQQHFYKNQLHWQCQFQYTPTLSGLTVTSADICCPYRQSADAFVHHIKATVVVAAIAARRVRDAYTRKQGKARSHIF